jgi:cytochrome c-type biogenesis protein CcmH/NrfF
MVDLTVLGAFGDYFVWWQLPLVILLVVLIVFWIMYRKRQM